MMNFLRFLFSKSFLRQLGLLVVASVIIVFITIYSVDRYTRHGQRVVSPDVIGLSVSEAGKIISELKLKYVVVDSSYVDNTKPGGIVEQQPSAGTGVKEGREISLIINPYSIKEVQIPELKDISMRQGLVLLEAAGFHLGRLDYVYSEYKDIIISAFIDSIEIKPGDLAKKGTTIDLVIGLGLGKQLIPVPRLSNNNFEDTKKLLQERSLSLGSVIYDSLSNNTSTTLLVYKQSPSPSKSSNVRLGRSIDIWLTSDSSKAYLAFQQDSIKNLADSLGISIDSLLIKDDSIIDIKDSTATVTEIQ